MNRSQVVELYSKLAGNKEHRQELYQLDDVNRQEILSKVYLLEKRGKTFGSSQYRRFMVEDGKLFQCIPNTYAESEKQRKEITIPNRVSTEIRIGGRKWNDECQGLPIRLFMEFDYRTPIYVYFNSITESQEIRAYVQSLIMRSKGKSMSRYARRWKHAVLQEFNDCLTRIGENSQQVVVRKNKLKAVAQAMQNWVNVDPLHIFVSAWQKLTQSRQQLLLKVQLRFRVLKSKTNQDLPLVSPNLRVYVAGKVLLESKLTPFKQHGKLMYKGSEENFTEVVEASLRDELVLEIVDGRAKWKSERMQLLDLWKYNQSIIGIPLQSSQPYPVVLFEYLFTPEYPSKPIWKLPLQFTPEHYNVLTEVMGCQNHHEPTVQHQLYAQRLDRHLRCRAEETIFYWMRRFTEVLELDDLINKGFESEPFKSMGEVKLHRGTIIYRHFVQLSRSVLFYDVEKIIWQHGHPHIRRLLNALKMFDNEPRRIVFTQKLYMLILRLLEMVSGTTMLFWNERLFEDSEVGRQSAVFFFTLVLARQIAPNYLSCTSKSKGLASNSLLFAYVLKLFNRQIWDKLSKLEINLEAFFGTHSVSLFAELIDGQTYFRVLDAVVTEAKIIRSEYNLTLIGLFMSLLDRVNLLESPFESAESFLFAVKLLAKNLNDPYEFLLAGDIYIERIRRQLSLPRFLELKQDLQNFYREQLPDQPTNLIVPKLYPAFSNYQHKAERVERLLVLHLDKVELHMDCPKLTLYLFQNNLQLLQHQFVDKCLQQLNFTVQMRLQSLSDVIVAVLPDHTTQAQFCKISPRNILSNCKYHLVLPLLKEEKYTLGEDDCNYAHLQLVIKEPTQETISQAKLDPPRRYLDFFMDTADIRPDITLLLKYATTVQTSENNYNLLYSQLGWLNNYYIIPSDQLMNMTAMPTSDGLRQCQEGELMHFFKVAKYSRCVYGRAVLSNTGHNYFIEYQKNGIRCASIHKAELPADLRGSLLANSMLSCYPLETVPSTHLSYLEFYLKVMDLPLIGYLTYNPNDIVEVPELSFELYLLEQRSTVIFTPQGDDFQLFSEVESAEVESAITFRKMKLRPKHLFRLPGSVSCLDNFLHHLRLNILKQIVDVEPPAPDKSLVKWPSRIIVRGVELAQPLPNLPFGKFLSLAIQTKHHVNLEFSDLGKPRLKQFKSLALLQYYRKWRSVDILCQIDSLYRYFLVEQQQTRRKFIVKEDSIILAHPPKVRIACEAEELQSSSSQLFKKLDRLF